MPAICSSSSIYTWHFGEEYSKYASVGKESSSAYSNSHCTLFQWDTPGPRAAFKSNSFKVLRTTKDFLPGSEGIKGQEVVVWFFVLLLYIFFNYSCNFTIIIIIIIPVIFWFFLHYSCNVFCITPGFFCITPGFFLVSLLFKEILSPARFKWQLLDGEYEMKTFTILWVPVPQDPLLCWVTFLLQSCLHHEIKGKYLHILQ